MAADVAERLAALTVDPATVEMPKIATGADAARTAPLPAVSGAAVATGEWKYTSKITTGTGQEMEVTSTRSVTREDGEDGATLVVDTAAETPMGSATDRYVLDAESLRPRSREVHQGPATIIVDYADGAVTGQAVRRPRRRCRSSRSWKRRCSAATRPSTR